MKILGMVFKISFGIILIWWLSLPFYKYDALPVLGLYALTSLIVVPPALLFSELQRRTESDNEVPPGTAHPYLFQMVEIACGLFILVYACLRKNEGDNIIIPLIYGLLFVLHGAVRLPRKHPKKDPE